MNEIRHDLVRVELEDRLPKRIFYTRGVVLRPDTPCVVMHNGNQELGRVVDSAENYTLEGEELDTREYIVREATDDDLDRARENREVECRACRACRDHVRKLNLDMKVSKASYTLDRNKLRIYFTSENRVDFRELVRELAAEFKTRIEMRQVGVRDESRMIGGVSVCGLELCCSKWLVKLRPISIKMAKEQNLALNPPNISGMCGRLLCCLSYEYEQYKGQRKKFPKIGSHVIVDGIEGRVKDINMLMQTVSVELNGRIEMMPLKEITIEKPDNRGRTPDKGDKADRPKRERSGRNSRRRNDADNADNQAGE